MEWRLAAIGDSLNRNLASWLPRATERRSNPKGKYELPGAFVALRCLPPGGHRGRQARKPARNRRERQARSDALSGRTVGRKKADGPMQKTPLCSLQEKRTKSMGASGLRLLCRKQLII